jgi:AmmeMemoRadiSam system protein A
MYTDYIHIPPGESASGSFSRFGAPETRFSAQNDIALLNEACRLAETRGIPAGKEGAREKEMDHGAMVPLYFINSKYKDYKLARFSISMLSPETHYQFGVCLRDAAANINRRTVIVASGDLSHKLTEDGPYGFAPEGPLFDSEVTAAMKSADFGKFLEFDESFCAAAAECGLRSFIVMAGALDGQAVRTEFMSYEGPFGVGYALCGYTPVGPDETRRFTREAGDAYVILSRRALEAYVRAGKKIKPPEGLSEMKTARAGVFVSLKKFGQLRGCIGTISPCYASIAQEIIENAIAAGTKDPRFPAVDEHELEDLTYSVDVLSPAEPISGSWELDVKKYGVIVSSGFRRGLLLPNLEGVDTIDEQVSIALRKAGIAPGESYKLERFEVVRHK